MLESQTGIEHACFKEYLCYHFKYAKDVKISREIFINFRESSNADPDVLPSALQDRLGGKETLYLLNWMRKEVKWQLFIKELPSQKWINLQMNFLPSIVVISGGVLYMQACTELAIVSLDKQIQDFRKLPEGEIVSINPCVVQYNEAQFEAGVAIVSFQEETGYKFSHYSINRKVSERQPIRQLVQFFGNKKYLKFAHFEVIVPNLFALALFNKSQFYLYDIKKGEIVENTKTHLIYSKLSTDQVPVVRWREHLPPIGFSKSLIVTIAVGNCIQIFFMHLKFRAEFEKQVAQASLNDLHSGNLIEWAGTQVAPYVCLQTPGIVIDLGISKKGILYYSKEKINSEIGQCSYLDLNWAFLESQVLTQEATIWRRYYQDRQFAEFSDGNRFFLPNRYPYQMVLSLSQNVNYEQLRPILLNKWRGAFKFKGILVFSEEMLIVRSGSLSVFRAVPEDLFHFENFSQTELNLLQQLECKAAIYARQVEDVFNKTESQFTEPLFRGGADRPFLKQRRYKVVAEEDYGDNDEAERRTERQFRKLQRELQLVMTERTQSMYATMSIKQFQMSLALNLLYDQLSHYRLTANSKAFRIQMQVQRQDSKEYQLQSCIIRMINYFNDLLQHSEQHYLIFGDNLLARFAAKHSQCISADIDRTVMTYLRLLMQNLFPIRTTNYANSQIQPEDNYDYNTYRNPYIEFLIEELQKGIMKERAGQQGATVRVKLIREQLTCLLDIGFLDNSSIYFTKFWRNSSLFKALLLSNSLNLSAYFCQYLLRKDSSAQLLHFYTELREFMTPQRIFIVENSLFFSHSFHYLPIDGQLLQNGSGLQQQSELDSYPQLVGRLKQQICSQNALQRSGKTSKQATFVLNSIDGLIEADQFDQGQFQIVRQKLSTIAISDPQQYLYFLERALKKCIHLFSCKVTIPEWRAITDQPNQQQNDLLKVKKAELLDYLSLVRQCFLHYKRTYKRMYEQSIGEDQKQLQVSDVQRQHVFEMIMMKERFIDPKEFHLQIEGQLGLLCCSLTLKMLSDALHYFSDSLQVKQNLACFWLNNIKGAEKGGKEEFEMAALSLNVVYFFAPELMASYLKLDKEVKESALAIYQKTKYQSNYEFFNLFKDEAF